MIDYYDLLETTAIDYTKTMLPDRFTVPDKQMSKSDDTIATGGFNSFFVTYPGSMPKTRDGAGSAGQNTIEVTFEILIDAWSRWSGSEKNSWDLFKAYRAELFHIFNISKGGRTLGRAPGIREAWIDMPERPRYIPLNVGSKDSIPAFIGQVASLFVVRIINKE